MLRSKLILPGLLVALAGGAFAQGDDCGTATLITTTGAFPFDSTLNTDSGFGVGTCLPVANNDVFWEWTAPAAGNYVFDTAGTSFADTLMAIYTGTGCTATCFGWVNDIDAASGDFHSRIQINGFPAGFTIVIQVAGVGAADQGPGVLNIYPAPAAPANNACGTATPITGLGATAFDNSGATSSGFTGGGTCVAGSTTITRDMFYQWTAPAAGDYQFDTIGSSINTKLSVHAGTGCLATCVGYNDNIGGTNFQSSVVVTGASMGDTFLIQVGSAGFWNVGAGVLNVSSFFDPCAGAVDDGLEQNDLCTTPYVMGVGSYPGLYVSNTDKDFYSITVAAGEILTVTLNQIAGDTDFNIYDASCTLIANLGGSFTYTNTTGAADTIIVEAVNYILSPTDCSDYDLTVASNPDICQTAGLDDSFEDNDDCANAAPVADGTYPGLFVWRFDSDHYSMCVADGATLNVDILFSNAAGDLDMFLWDAADANCGTGNGTTELAEGFSGTDNETLTWTNTSGSDMDLVLEVNVYGLSASACNDYDMTIAGSGCTVTVVGTPFCDPANNNSTGVPAVLTGSWGTGVGSDLHLEMTGGVPGQLAYMLCGNEATAGFTIMGANGPLCLVGTPTAVFYRYNVPGPMNSIGGFDGTATYINVSGTSTTGFGFDVPTMIPAGVPFAIMTGDTWHFQGWYRDTPAGSGQSNFTNGLSVTF